LQEVGVAEIMLAPESKLIGQTLREVELSSRYDLNVLAIRHRGEKLTTQLEDQTLDFGDTLLMAGGWGEIQRLRDEVEDFVVLTLPAEYSELMPARHRAPIAVAILVGMVAAMAAELVANAAAVLIAALAMIATRCVKLDTIYRVDQIKLKDASAFRYIGKGTTPIVDLFDIPTGRATYGIDAKLPGMKYAVVARPPVFGGKVVSFDAAAAMKAPGVEKVVTIEGTPAPAKFQPLGGIAVIARNTWSAIKGREALNPTWEDGPNGSYDSTAFKAQLEETARRPGKVVRNDGDAEKALGSAAKVVSAEYYIPHSAHATMEPPSATVRIADGKCGAWACVQSPGNTREELAKKLGLKEEDVTVHVTLLGGGFGRKSKCDFVLEAALLSKAMGGAPVKVIWTREDDLQNGYYHTVSAER